MSIECDILAKNSRIKQDVLKQIEYVGGIEEHKLLQLSNTANRPTLRGKVIHRKPSENDGIKYKIVNQKR